MGTPDPATWIEFVLRGQPWPDELLRALVRLYLHVPEERRAALRAALPGLAEDAALWQALRASERRN